MAIGADLAAIHGTCESDADGTGVMATGTVQMEAAGIP